MIKTLLVALPLVLVSMGIKAESEETGFWSFQFENDLWGSNDDRFYTHGTEISYASVAPAPDFLNNLIDVLPFYRKGEDSIHGYSIGQKIFTPADISQAGLIANDRPYAGWLYVDTGIAHVFKRDQGKERINGMVLTLGIVGPYSYADDTQRYIHRYVDSDIPQGWANQLDTELGINLSYIQKLRRLYRVQETHQLEFSYHAGLTLGNVYSYASLGLMGRWGTQLENDIGPPSISPGFPGLPAFKPSPAFNWYLFGGVEVRLMGRNIFLDGNTFHDSHSVEKEYLVADVQFGFAFHYHDVRVSFSNLLRTKEFVGQVERTQYGAINVTIYAL